MAAQELDLLFLAKAHFTEAMGDFGRSGKLFDPHGDAGIDGLFYGPHNYRSEWIRGGLEFNDGRKLLLHDPRRLGRQSMRDQSGKDNRLPFAELDGRRGVGREVVEAQVPTAVPVLEGDLRLIDSESGGAVEITANSYALAEYKRRLGAHQAAIEAAVQRSGGRHLLVTTSQSFDDVVTGSLKRYGWVSA